MPIIHCVSWKGFDPVITPHPLQAKSVRLLIADVDGTLVTKEKRLTARARSAVQKLHTAGIKFAITSGRPPRGMSMLIRPLHLTTPISAFNGGLFVRPDLTIINQKVLPLEVAGKVIQAIETHRLDVWVYRGKDWFVLKKNGLHVDREAWTVKFKPKVVSDFNQLLDHVVKIVGVSDDLAAVARAESDVRREFGQHVSAARSQPYYLDVTHPDANKGGVVRRLSREFKIPKPQIATIGDMPNDVLMFALSGISIAMGNADTQVQRAARHVTASNEEDGFALAVEKYVL
ncbi:MAG: HAD family phosphatase [Phycisphaerae bacterium]|nr:HAD family phosphatase [Phycisphaerae bacterium]